MVSLRLNKELAEMRQLLWALSRNSAKSGGDYGERLAGLPSHPSPNSSPGPR